MFSARSTLGLHLLPGVCIISISTVVTISFFTRVRSYPTIRVCAVEIKYYYFGKTVINIRTAGSVNDIWENVLVDDLFKAPHIERVS